jgi:hypothetical protein
MKKLIILSIFLTSCISLPAQLQPSVNLTPQRTQEARTATQTTPTLDYVATIANAENDAYRAQQDSMAAQQQAINAQETSQAAQVAIVAFTAQAEQIQLEYIRATQQADSATAVMYVTQIGMTQQSDLATQTYQPTADAMRSTQQAIVLVNATDNSAERTAVAYEPVRVEQLNSADNIRRFGWLDYFARVMLSIAGIVGVLGLFAFLWKWLDRPITMITVPDELPEIIPLNVDRSNGGWHATRADVPVTIETLTTFAVGIIKQGKAPAFDVWQGIINRADLTQIRGFLLRENMAQPVKNGEITIIQKGRDFLARVSETGDAPLPYVCAAPKSDYIPAVRTSNVGTEAVGGL